MNGFVTIGCVVLAILCAAHMLRPVSRSEKTYLLHLADGDNDCERIADDAVAKRWLTWAQYDATMQLIKRIQAKKEESEILAASAARKIVRNARQKI
jgi:hypothetical protein